ncbi:hypothetical protein KEM52_002709 [Ascosphaera acerosa]|nr:hypothetical protein KEM52_002709 [Ascosphaera acerosa]
MPSQRYPHIYIVGAHSTGKTTLFETLALLLAAYLRATHMPLALRTVEERARIVHNSGLFSRQDLADKAMRSHDLQQLVQELQFQAEDQALALPGGTGDSHGGSDSDSDDHGGADHAQPLLLCDRSGLDPIAYDLQYAPCLAETRRRLIATPAWRTMRDRMRRSLVILCPVQPAFIRDDGVRLVEPDLAAWDALHDVFRRLLRENDIPFHVLPRHLLAADERAQYVLKLWKNHVAPVVEHRQPPRTRELQVGA